LTKKYRKLVQTPDRQSLAQLAMIDVVRNVEREIQRLRTERKESKSTIPGLKAAGNMAQVRQVQQRVNTIDARLEQLEYFRECVLFIGDTIASRLLEVDAIKHFAGFQSPGFLIGKSGLEAEIDAAWHFALEGHFVLFNDLTHSVRLGDLTLVKDGIPRTFEVKKNAEGYADVDSTTRQIVLPMAIHQYIRDDVSRMTALS